MNYCIVVADGSRARFFTLEQPGIPELEGGPDLAEHKDLVNPEKEQRSRDIFSNLKSGRNQAPGNGPGHGYDDHRDQHEGEFARRFARRVAREIASFVEERRAARLVLAADPRMLGLLRGEMDQRLVARLRLLTLSRDISSLSAPLIHKRLAREGLLPARSAP